MQVFSLATGKMVYSVCCDAGEGGERQEEGADEGAEEGALVDWQAVGVPEEVEEHEGLEVPLGRSPVQVDVGGQVVACISLNGVSACTARLHSAHLHHAHLHHAPCTPHHASCTPHSAPAPQMVSIWEVSSGAPLYKGRPHGITGVYGVKVGEPWPWRHPGPSLVHGPAGDGERAGGDRGE